MSDNVPDGWSISLLSEVVYFAGRIGWRGLKAEEYTKSGAILLSVHNLNSGPDVDFTVVNYVSMVRYEESPEIKVQANDVLLTKDGAGIGKAGFVRSLPGAATVNSSLLLLRSLGALEPKFLFYSVIGPGMQNLVKERITGSTTPHLFQKDIKQFELLVPPPVEQRRIVAKVETLLGRVNAARQRLAKVPAILNRFRKAVLAAACGGQLTLEWRKTETNLEPTSLLIERIRCSEKRDIRQVHDANLPAIPNCWAWVYLPEVGYMNRGKSRHRPRNAPHLYGGPYPFVQTGDIAQSGGRITAHRQSYSESGLAQSRLWQAGTICITIAANIADSAILTYPACFPDSVVGLIPNSDFCVAEYVEFFIRTARDNLSQFAPATAQKNINVAILNVVAVPLPPVLEQHEIVRRVDALFRLAETIEKRITAATERADKLTQAILAKAFRGELVPTEAELARREGRDYEPASVLLERIRAERAQSENGTARKARTKRGS